MGRDTVHAAVRAGLRGARVLGRYLPAEGSPQPTSARAGSTWLAALVVGTILGPVLHAVPGLPSALSLFVALFAVGLPAITYMLLAGMWLVQLAAGQVSTPRR
jgi:hypothetical protein